MPKASREVGKGEGIYSSVGVTVGDGVEVGVAVFTAGCVGRSVGVCEAAGWVGWIVGLAIPACVWRAPVSDMQACREAASINPRIPIVTHRSLLIFVDFGDIFILLAVGLILSLP